VKVDAGNIHEMLSSSGFNDDHCGENDAWFDDVNILPYYPQFSSDFGKVFGTRDGHRNLLVDSEFCKPGRTRSCMLCDLFLFIFRAVEVDT
jgi:hypothetical protein